MGFFLKGVKPVCGKCFLLSAVLALNFMFLSHSLSPQGARLHLPPPTASVSVETPEPHVDS